MLQTLDPHSSFLDPRSYAQLRERQEGSYYGLGIRSRPIDGDITVMSLFEDSPAYKKGMRRGDVIARIKSGSKADEPKGWTTRAGGRASWWRRKGKGRRSASRSAGAATTSLIDLEIERDEVNIPTVRGAFMIDKDDRLHQLARFLGDVERDLGDALEDLTAKGMKRLVSICATTPAGRSTRPSRSRTGSCRRAS